MTQSALAPCAMQYEVPVANADPTPTAEPGGGKGKRMSTSFTKKIKKRAGRAGASGGGGDKNDGGTVRNSVEEREDGHLRGSMNSVMSSRSSATEVALRRRGSMNSLVSSRSSATEVAPRRKPRGSWRTRSLFSSLPGHHCFRKKGSACHAHQNHSSHPLPPSGVTPLGDLLEDMTLRPNSEHDATQAEALRQRAGAVRSEGAVATALGAERLLRGDSPLEIEASGSEGPPCAVDLDASSSRAASISSVGESVSVISDSWSMLEVLGNNPSRQEIAAVAAVRAREYIEECFSADVAGALDRKTWEAIPEYAKADLDVGKFLGKGSFSDVFEVTCAAPPGAEGEVTPPAVESLGTDSQGLGALDRTHGASGPGGMPSLEELSALRAEFRGGRPSGTTVRTPGASGPGGMPSLEELSTLKAEFRGGRPSGTTVRTPGASGPGGMPSLEELSTLKAEFRSGPSSGTTVGASTSGGAPSAEEMSALRAEFRGLRAGPSRAVGGLPSCQETAGLSRGSGELHEFNYGSLSPQNDKGESEGSDDMDQEIDAMFDDDRGPGKFGDALTEGVTPSADALDKEVDALFSKAAPPASSVNNLDDEYEAMFGPSDKDSNAGPSATGGVLARPSTAPQDFRPQPIGHLQKEVQLKPDPPPRRFQRRARRVTMDAGAGLARPAVISRQGTADDGVDRQRARRLTVAMKCLRPQIRSDAEQFMIGVEDLVHETAMLARFSHKHIIKLHGRAGGFDADSSLRLNDGYFILVDRLKDTLDDRIQLWKKSAHKAMPSVFQIRAAVAVADALDYLHSKNVIFRDLKPANVGFDNLGVLKLFDFGFAVTGQPIYHDLAGTRRYMAPEVGLNLGYHLPADIYSFGILLWEICALKKPFGDVKSAEEFEERVFKGGARPKLGKAWPTGLTKIMSECWDNDPEARPEMRCVKTNLTALAKDMANKTIEGRGGGLRSSMMRRISIG